MPIRYLGLTVLLLGGCDLEPTPIPSEYMDYVGVWEQGGYGQSNPYRFLQISASGYLIYASFEKSDRVTRCSTAETIPVKSVSSTRIHASLLLVFNVDLEVNSPPEAVGETWRMTVDGNELTRTDGRLEGFDYTWSCGDGELLREPRDAASERAASERADGARPQRLNS